MQDIAKKQSKPTDSYISYSKYVREELEKDLTEEDHKRMVQMYIRGVSVDECIERMRSKKQNG